jgi:hypothetical protein
MSISPIALNAVKAARLTLARTGRVLSMLGLGVLPSLVLGTSIPAWAATITAASCSWADVESAVGKAVDGDKVVVPAGTCTWAKPLFIQNKILTLQGAGIGQTVLIDGTSKQFDANFNVSMLVIQAKVGGTTRVTGFTFDGGTGVVDPNNRGTIEIRGTSKTFRLDNCRFLVKRTAGLVVRGWVYGVVDHNQFDIIDTQATGGTSIAIYVHNGETYNGQGMYGDGSWADAPSLGTADALFIEDTTFTGPVQTGSRASVALDGWRGGRVVFRYNTSNETIGVSTHGTASPGRWRGMYQHEIYNNTFKRTGIQWPGAIAISSGIAVSFNNTVKGNFREVGNYNVRRVDTAYAPWGRCDGTSPWDQNMPGQKGYACLDQLGRGRGDVIAGDTPINQVIGIAAFPRQVVEPAYAWNNTLNGAPAGMVSERPDWIVEGRDFFNTVKPGYKPYSYPHPLVSGSTIAPSPPSNLTVR